MACFNNVFFIVLDIRLIKRDCTPLVKAKVRQSRRVCFFDKCVKHRFVRADAFFHSFMAYLNAYLK